MMNIFEMVGAFGASKYGLRVSNMNIINTERCRLFRCCIQQEVGNGHTRYCQVVMDAEPQNQEEVERMFGHAFQMIKEQLERKRTSHDRLEV
jgi:hypothetical protein